MHLTVIFRVLGVMLAAFSLALLPSCLLAVLFNDGNLKAFGIAFAVTLTTGCLLWFPLRKTPGDLRTRDGFIITVLFWLVLALFGSLPFILSSHHSLSFTDAFFESMSGPEKDSKLTPRITETAKALWYIYFSLTAACAFCYWLAGMSLFDAVGQGFATVAIGGFSTHDASIVYFDNTAIEMVAVVFMMVSGINFSLHSGVRGAGIIIDGNWFRSS